MVHLKIKVAHYYELRLNEGQTFVFAVLYGFERGKNKDVYTLRMYNDTRDVEFPIEESTFERWVKEGRIQELSAEEALMKAM
jgi:hypothetical protein